MRVVARRGPLAIVQTRHGWVVAAAGIDASNVAQDALVLLPEDADASARALRARLRELLGVDVAVVVSDTFGRTWREGLTDVAVGSAGITALVDHRGAVDAHGNRLETTRVAVVDELASAADLVKGKLAGVPVAVVRGLPLDRPGRTTTGTRPLVRLPADDLFPYGARDLVGSRAPGADLVPRAGELEAVAAAFRAASAALPEFPVVLRYGGEGDGVVDVHLADAADHDDGAQPRRAARRGRRAAARRGLGHPLGAGRHAGRLLTRREAVGRQPRRPDRRGSLASRRGHPRTRRAGRLRRSTSCRTATPAAGSPSGTAPTSLQEAIGFGFTLAQANHSVSARGALRGVHFALVPPGQAKYVYCPPARCSTSSSTSGSVSPTFGVHDAVLLDSEAAARRLPVRGPRATPSSRWPTQAR